MSFVTIEQLFKALVAHGATPLEAAGITGNSVSEVGPSTPDLSPDSELRTDWFTADCCGIVCWEPVYWNPPRPTGNAVNDMNAQIDYLKSTGGFERASGSTATEAGQTFAHSYEACAQCMVGGYQWMRRGEQAASVYRLAQEHGWDKPPAPPKVGPSGTIRFEGSCHLETDTWTVKQTHGTAHYGNENKQLEAEVALVVRKGGNHAWHIKAVSDKRYTRPKKVTPTNATGIAKFKGSWDLKTGKTTIDRVEGTAHYGTDANAWAAVLQLNITDGGKKHHLVLDRIDRHTKPLT